MIERTLGNFGEDSDHPHASIRVEREIIAGARRISARGHPSWNPGTHGMQGARVVKEDGSVLGAPVED